MICWAGWETVLDGSTQASRPARILHYGTGTVPYCATEGRKEGRKEGREKLLQSTVGHVPTDVAIL